MNRLVANFVFVLFGSCWSISAASEGEDLFENEIRPVLATRCVDCHGADRQDGGLRLDAKKWIAETEFSRFVKGEMKVPKSCLLNPAESVAFSGWIESGLPWPDDVSFKSHREEAAKNHWAFQPIREPDVPAPDDRGRLRNPIDAFVMIRLQEASLSHSLEADRRTLIRRLYYTLTGLPPSPLEVSEFVGDPDPGAYDKLVDKLLDSPHYGEHWARHWLDVARYSDTKGYVYGREERFWTHAWAYRDWVVGALNSDMSYDRFLLLQLAADQLVDDPAGKDLAAMGFLTLGRRFQGVERDIIDDRIDVVTRGTMALTVGCARCHDHKFDPIPTADYYSLYGVFASSCESLRSIGDPDAGGSEFRAELEKRRKTSRNKLAKHRDEASARARKRIADYLYAQTELEKYPANGFDQIFSKDDLLPAFVHLWDDYLSEAAKRKDPVFVPWHGYANLPAGDFKAEAAKMSFSDSTVHPVVAAAFKVPPESMREVADRYGRLFSKVEPNPDDPLSRVLYGPESPAEIPDLPVVHTETFFHSDAVTELYKLEGEIYRWINRTKVPAPHALILEDREQTVESPVFIRGNPLNKGKKEPRHFLTMLSGGKAERFQNGSGRLELAKAIVNPENPLTARVMVNRVWGHHFGKGLVTTPSNFGLQSNPPSHPELLDWLASRFIAEGWSLKKLHRRILLSGTFRQSSKTPNQEALQIDPANRLLWRMNARRLTWEQFRDSMFLTSNELDLQIGGKPVSLFEQPYAKRRTVYGLVDRQFLPGLLRTFDFANPDLHIPRRAETTVPQQALFFLNDPLVLDRARSLALYAKSGATSREGQIRQLFQRTLQRDPTDLELEESAVLLENAGRKNSPPQPITARQWTYGYGAVDENKEQVTGFTKLPHFNGEAWQGGSGWPDAKLGWVQLTARGGHPGNDRSHASIRRWTAPRAMTIALDSKLTHESKPGDGIRAFVISSKEGKLAMASIHEESIDLDLASLEVEKGETIDFVVDIGEVLNSDQFRWNATILETPEGENSVRWNSQIDFPKREVRQLTGWEQLAQALLCSNEFLFVD